MYLFCKLYIYTEKYMTFYKHHWVKCGESFIIRWQKLSKVICELVGAEGNGR